MWVYYALILLSVGMFGCGFSLQDVYRKKRGSSLRVSMESACIGALAGFFVLLAINRFAFSCTPFTLLMAALAALNAMAFTFCTFRALDYINLSLFSLFSMLGGMMLPFFQGILFFGERFTPAKAICVAFIVAALLCTVEKGEKSKGTIFYLGIFVLNGMSGVISKIFTTVDLPKAGAADFSICAAAVTVVLSGAAWLALGLLEKRTCAPSHRDGGTARVSRQDLQAYGAGALYGAINKVANFLLVFALVHVDASVQYPMVTGGTMIVSTALSYMGERKPGRRELLGVALAFCGMLALFLIPA